MGFNEADTRAKLVDPALYGRQWTEAHIKREETAGTIEVIDGKPRRRARGRVDYTLRVRVTAGSQPVAVGLIEAKAEDLAPAHGLEQAKAYAASKRLNVPFVFSSNGHLFVEYDRLTGQTSKAKPLAEFPTPDELRARYEAGMGFSLNDPPAQPLLTRYVGGEATRRYYQDAAIRAVLEKVAKGEKRALLSLATGSGKTFIAVNLLKRIADAGQLRRALFVCDRDELRNQGLGAFRAVFGNDAAAAGAGNPEKNARVVIATYQTLDVDTDDADANFLATHYPPNYFSHIVIDECHRSAWGKWSQVLTMNPDAVQVGLTATPRQIICAENTDQAKADAKINADNLRYFGPPVYEYDMSQGIEDGYLAACAIQKGTVNIDDTGITKDAILARKFINATTGQPITADQLNHLYEKTSFENRILLPDRVLAMCLDLFQHLLDTGGPEQKTIIFCARDRHAEEVAITLNNLYADWCKTNNRKPLDMFAFKCTAASGGGDYLADLRGGARHHFIATTVDLLTTGVDVPCVRNIVFFKYVESPISFYQMVGRGTRLDPASGKLMFRLYDYTNATRLFGQEFRTKATVERAPKTPPTGGGTTDPPPLIVQVEGFDVQVSDAGRLILTMVDGKALPVTVEVYRQKLAAKVLEEADTLDKFRARWVVPADRQLLLGRLPDAGRSALLVRQLQEMDEYDLYDVLVELAYGAAARTREARTAAFTYKHAAWLGKLPPTTAATLRAIASQFERGGTEGLENPQVFQTPEVRTAGGLDALKIAGKPADLLRETKERMFAA